MEPGKLYPANQIQQRLRLLADVESELLGGNGGGGGSVAHHGKASEGIHPSKSTTTTTNNALDNNKHGRDESIANSTHNHNNSEMWRSCGTARDSAEQMRYEELTRRRAVHLTNQEVQEAAYVYFRFPPVFFSSCYRNLINMMTFLNVTPLPSERELYHELAKVGFTKNCMSAMSFFQWQLVLDQWKAHVTDMTQAVSEEEAALDILMQEESSRRIAEHHHQQQQQRLLQGGEGEGGLHLVVPVAAEAFTGDAATVAQLSEAIHGQPCQPGLSEWLALAAQRRENSDGEEEFGNGSSDESSSTATETEGGSDGDVASSAGGYDTPRRDLAPATSLTSSPSKYSQTMQRRNRRDRCVVTLEDIKRALFDDNINLIAVFISLGASDPDYSEVTAWDLFAGIGRGEHFLGTDGWWRALLLPQEALLQCDLLNIPKEIRPQQQPQPNTSGAAKFVDFTEIEDEETTLRREYLAFLFRKLATMKQRMLRRHASSVNGTSGNQPPLGGGGTGPRSPRRSPHAVGYMQVATSPSTADKMKQRSIVAATDNSASVPPREGGGGGGLRPPLVITAKQRASIGPPSHHSSIAPLSADDHPLTKPFPSVFNSQQQSVEIATLIGEASLGSPRTSSGPLGVIDVLPVQATFSNRSTPTPSCLSPALVGVTATSGGCRNSSMSVSSSAPETHPAAPMPTAAILPLPQQSAINSPPNNDIVVDAGASDSSVDFEKFLELISLHRLLMTRHLRTGRPISLDPARDLARVIRIGSSVLAAKSGLMGLSQRHSDSHHGGSRHHNSQHDGILLEVSPYASPSTSPRSKSPRRNGLISPVAPAGAYPNVALLSSSHRPSASYGAASSTADLPDWGTNHPTKDGMKHLLRPHSGAHGNTAGQRLAAPHHRTGRPGGGSMGASVSSANESDRLFDKLQRLHHSAPKRCFEQAIEDAGGDDELVRIARSVSEAVTRRSEHQHTAASDVRSRYLEPPRSRTVQVPFAPFDDGDVKKPSSSPVMVRNIDRPPFVVAAVKTSPATKEWIMRDVLPPRPSPRHPAGTMGTPSASPPFAETVLWKQTPVAYAFESPRQSSSRPHPPVALMPPQSSTACKPASEPPIVIQPPRSVPHQPSPKAAARHVSAAPLRRCLDAAHCSGQSSPVVSLPSSVKAIMPVPPSVSIAPEGKPDVIPIHRSSRGPRGRDGRGRKNRLPACLRVKESSQHQQRVSIHGAMYHPGLDDVFLQHRREISSTSSDRAFHETVMASYRSVFQQLAAL